MVGPKAVAAEASVMGGFAADVGLNEGGDGRNSATATATDITSRAIKIHTERLSVEDFGAICLPARFSRFMCALRLKHDNRSRGLTREYYESGTGSTTVKADRPVNSADTSCHSHP